MRSAIRTVGQVCAVMILILVLGSVQSWAQLDTGSIAGVVQDKSGAVVSGAAVKVTNAKTGRTWAAKTGSIGEYSVIGLPVGPYKVEVSHAGFKTGVVSNIELHPAETPRADVTLDVGASGETVNVSADAATVNTTTSESGATIDSKSVTNLPLNGRDFTSLIALVPGSVTTGQFGQNSLGGFETSLAGVNVLLDGADATRIDVNATSTQLGRQESRISRASVDSIQEFKVLSGVYSAEYGRSTGDVVNVITKSGGNALHGTVFEFFRNNALDANNYFAKKGEDTPLHMNQFGGNLSGPIKKDKLFFFVNYEGVRQIVNNPTTVTVLSDSARASMDPSMFPVRDALPRVNLPDPVFKADGVTPRTDLGWYFTRLRNELREDTGSVKVDYNASQKDTFSIRYNIADSFTSTQYGVAVGQVSPSYSRNHLLKATWNHAFQNNLLNEFGIAFNRPQTDSLGGGGDFPIFQCSSFWGCNQDNNLGSTPGPALFSNRRPQYSIQFLDSVSWVKGRQTIRAGMDIRKNNTDDALDPQVFLAYDNIADFLSNAYAVQVSTLGHTMVNVHNTNYGLFIQDDIRLTPRLTVNLGVRYEYNSVLQGSQIGNFDIATLTLLPQGGQLYKPDRNNFAPRIGFSWDPFGTGKTVIRGGAGIFYNPLLTGAALSLAGNYQQSYSYGLGDLFNGVSCPAGSWNGLFGLLPNFPVHLPFPACTPSTPISVNSLDQNMRDTYAGHWSFGIQQEVTKNTVAEVNYVGNRGIKLPAGAAYAGLEYNYDSFGIKRYTQYGNVRRLGNFLDSNYNALQASLRRRISQGLTIDANYTWSHELDDAVNILLSSFQNSMNPGGDYASGDIDVRHNFTLGLVYDVPAANFLPKRVGGGWQVSTLFQARGGLPVNIALSSPFLGLDEVRPNAPAAQVNTTANGPNGFFLPKSQFPTPAAGQYGTLGRNAGRGPGFAQMDMALSKTMQLNERFRMQFRAEMFNLLNHPNFANPSGYLDDVNFGNSTSTIGTRVGTGTSRQTQLAMKFIF